MAFSHKRPIARERPGVRSSHVRAPGVSPAESRRAGVSGARLGCLLLACLFGIGCTDASRSSGESGRRDDSINGDPRFVHDMISLESAKISVQQPATVTFSRADGSLTRSNHDWPKAELDPETKASACRLLREMVAKHPLQRSFRSIQKDYFVAPDYSFSFSLPHGGAFTVTLYRFSPELVEIKHDLGGAGIVPDKNMQSNIYSFFAQCIASERPETAKALRSYSEHLTREPDRKEDNTAD
ncbi:MAG: hypothetical protein GX621_17100 [Pirellulaceae bacterium]|nr:hypothetical protein [Pirellulaceae bacterium]